MESGAPAVETPLAGRAPEAAGEEEARIGGSTARRRLLTLLKAAISLGLIAWVLRGASIAEVVTAMRSAHLPLLLLAFSLYVAGWLISIARWRVLLIAQRVPAPVGFLLESYLVGIFFNNILPSTIGGDTIRAYDSWRLGKRKADAVTVIFVDRFIGTLALLLFALAATFGLRLLPVSLPLLPLWMGLAAGGFIFLSWMLFIPPARLNELPPRIRAVLPELIRTKLTRLAEAISVFRGNRGAIAKALGLSLFLQLNVILHYYLIARALGLPVPAFAFFLIVPVALAVMAIPVSINAIGIRESVFAFFFAMFGVAAVEAVAFAWVAYGLVVAQGLVGGVVYAARR